MTINFRRNELKVLSKKKQDHQAVISDVYQRLELVSARLQSRRDKIPYQ